MHVNPTLGLIISTTRGSSGGVLNAASTAQPLENEKTKSPTISVWPQTVAAGSCYDLLCGNIELFVSEIGARRCAFEETIIKTTRSSVVLQLHVPDVDSEFAH